MFKSVLLAATAVMAIAGSAGAQTPSTTPAPAPAAPAPPACSGPEYRQLDFWAGDWNGEFDAGGGQKGHAVNRITKDEYGPCVIVEHFYQADIDFKGHSVSMYDAPTKTWRQTWVDNQGSWFTLEGGPVTGQKHIFELNMIRTKPTSSYARMIWEDVKPNSFTWRWQKRKSEADAWQDSWVIQYTRKPPA